MPIPPFDFAKSLHFLGHFTPMQREQSFRRIHSPKHSLSKARSLSFGSPDLQGRTVAVQGIGSVGEHAVVLLLEAGAIFGIDSLNPSGFNRQRAMDSISRIYEAVEKVLTLAKEQKVPTHRAADLLA